MKGDKEKRLHCFQRSRPNHADDFFWALYWTFTVTVDCEAA
jgi:hypothetical protein